MRKILSFLIWFFSVFFLLIGFFNAHSFILTKEYISVPGWISDVETTSKFVKGRKTARYNYIIHWYMDGELYSRQVEKAIQPPDETISEVWADVNHDSAIASSPKEIEKEAFFDFIIAISLGMIGLLLYKSSNESLNIRKETWETIYYSGIVGFAALLGGAALMLAILCTESNLEAYTRHVLTDLLVIFLILAIGAGIAIRKIKKKL